MLPEPREQFGHGLRGMSGAGVSGFDMMGVAAAGARGSLIRGQVGSRVGIRAATVRGGGVEDSTHAVLGCGRVIGVRWIEHRNDCRRPKAIEPGPLTLLERCLHFIPMSRLDRRVRIDEREELGEVLEVDAHLIDELTQSDLLRRCERVEVAAICLGVIDGLNDGDTQQQVGVAVADVGG